MKKENIILISGAALYVLLLALFAILDFKPIVTYTAAFISSSLLFIFICLYILKHDIPAKLILVLAAAGIALRIAFIPVHPVGSDDYYRYVWDGKVMAAGINPYAYAPDSPALNSLHSDILPKRVNFPGMKTIYPPLSEELFFVSYLIGGESFLGIKLLLLLFDLASILGLYLILKKLKLPVKNILIYILCPLPVFQFFIDGHVDGFGLPLLIFSLFFYLDNKKLLSYFFLGLSVCIKPLGLILLPIYFFNEERLADKFKSAAVTAAVVAAM